MTRSEMSKLHISATLSLPLDFVTQTQAILAIKRVGKTYTASVQAEELLKANQQIVAIDVTGAWWGLRSNAAGDGPGFPVAIFGGDHGDVPLEESGGEVLADALVTERFSAIIDVSLFRKAQAQRFLAVFFETLYRRNREAMHLFMDEADFYAPQKPFGEEARVLGAVNDIVRRGGIKGIGCTLITQRPAVLNKDVLTQCGILTALRISHPKDMAAIREWVDVHSVRSAAEEMTRSLPSLTKGDAWVWAPGWPTEQGIFERIAVRKRLTFDSGATPKAGQTIKQPKVLAEVDLRKLGEQIAATVEKQKANDPKQLKAQIAELQRQISKPTAVAAPQVDVDATVKEALAVQRASMQEQFLELMQHVKLMREGIAKIATDAAAIIGKPIPLPDELPEPKIPTIRTITYPDHRSSPAPRRPVHQDEAAGDLSRPQREILQRLAEFFACGRTAVRLSWLAGSLGTTARSRGFEENIKAVKRTGYVASVPPESAQLTPAGAKLAGWQERLSGEQLRDKVTSMLTGPQAEMLRRLYMVKSLSLEALADYFGTTVRSRGFEENVKALRRNELIEVRDGDVRCADWLFL